MSTERRSTRDAPDAGALPGARTRLHDGTVGGVELYSARPRHGEGPPVLLVHSVNAAASAFEMWTLYDRVGLRRPTYAIDLPGFGLSDRTARPYTPRLMTDAILGAVAHVRTLHDGQQVDAVALSLSCEFLARAATEAPAGFRSLALVSPTGMSGLQRLDGPPQSTRGIAAVRAIVGVPWIGRTMFRLLTRPRVVRYFLERTFGTRKIDEALWGYAVYTAKQPGAEHAPLWFLSGHLFSGDATTLYEGLRAPVWLTHGVRGDFVDYRGADSLAARENWTREVFDTGAMPHLELPDELATKYLAFLDRVDR